MAEGNSNLSASFMDNFICKICLEVLDDPIQCQNNEHYFCRKCITKHLHDNTETCPLCADQLTLETLRPPSRIIFDVVSQLKKPRCDYVSRGCTENVKVEELVSHELTCGYAPVVCSNEGCQETVNRRDKESHETQECKFRKMTYNDFEQHQCTLKEEMNEVKLRLDEMNNALKQLTATQTKVLEKLKAHDQIIKNFQYPLHRASSAPIKRERIVVNGQIFVFGGRRNSCRDGTQKSLEVFNWSTKTWTLVQDCLFHDSFNSFSFTHGNKIMVCGGASMRQIEYLTPSESGYSASVTLVSLPCGSRYNGVLYENRILTFNEAVVETSLESPGESRTLLEVSQWATGLNSSAGVHCIGTNIYIAGRRGNSMEKYDVVKNELLSLPSLSSSGSAKDKATVQYKDNIVMLGGERFEHSLNEVAMFNITTHEYKKLPPMLESRANCAAVIMGDVIIAMGGRSITGSYRNAKSLKTAEYYVMGDTAWRELPAMNLARYGATVCLYV